MEERRARVLLAKTRERVDEGEEGWAADKILADETQSCALDMADCGPWTHKEIAHVLGMTRERVRQIEREALERARRECSISKERS